MFSAKLLFSGIVIGIINSLFGAGGGIIAVPVLKNSGLTQKSAQASAIAVILPLSVISMLMYMLKGYFSFSDGIWYIPFGLIGAFVGTKAMDKASNRLLKLLFSVLLIYSGLRMIIK